MSEKAPILIWFRRDLRLSDHAALTAACASGHPVIPVFIHDPLVEGLGAAPKWRLGLGIGALAACLKAKNSQLVLRKGADALAVLQELIAQTGAGAVYWTRLYDPDSAARDANIKDTLKKQGVEARSFGGHLMFEPWTVETKTGGYYKVFTPFWNAVKKRGVDVPRPVPETIKSPVEWPYSEDIESWNMGAAMGRGVTVVRPFVRLGEQAAQERLGDFIEGIVAGYADTRDQPGIDGTSNLSENLAVGEISPHQCWHAGRRGMEEGKAGAEIFLKELVWREFAYHLMYHTPRILEGNWRQEWDAFPWKDDARAAEVWAWKKGRTGIPFVDAAMRELYVTGRMHNRGRMIVASYLTKHLMTHWRIGLAWFENCLIDWDPASNAMGWQWSAGSGPDATPYFRVFNPETQLERFDKDGAYRTRWIAEGRSSPHRDALRYFEAVPRQWAMTADDPYPDPLVTPAEGRARALAAYSNRGF
ncbi:deoxyribodipyrimidine photo-lyase [Sulfitobacter sp. F26204]|uniref:cryptochrome/photolyase family protein n=1 Tax=Sulfitobacter sp. F26204 TaxID=2996014 RepID=UPI00225E449F|nr:deoxyribodipyrimidine photo-lyase [Sulfitobacter sp. F26204]MCX7559650.1 deoxyribodipyrimidine photo-lyase [Sulfitobacter sp. F26204]